MSTVSADKFDFRIDDDGWALFDDPRLSTRRASRIERAMWQRIARLEAEIESLKQIILANTGAGGEKP